MNQFLKALAICMMTFFVIDLITGCSKSNTTPTPPATTANVTISSLSLTTGPYNTLVTINGSGFSTNSTNNQVFFNGAVATIAEYSANQLLVYVPLAAGTGAVSVKVNGTTAIGPIFNYQVSEVVTAFAGQNNPGSANGIGSAASFNEPAGLATDAAGNVYVADMNNNLIRKITPAGLVSTIAGNGTRGSTNGVGTAATFNMPNGVAVDAAGNVYVAEFGSGLIRKIDPSGSVSTFAGSGLQGVTDGIGTAASFGEPSAITIDASGYLYVVDEGDGRVRKISPAGVVTTLAGGSSGTGFSNPTGIAEDQSGNLYVACQGDNTIKKVTQAGVVTTVATGSAELINLDATSLRGLFQIAIDGNGNILVPELLSFVIAKVSQTGTITNFAGNGKQQYTDGTVSAASFISLVGITVANNGTIYVSDLHAIRKISMQ